MTTPRMKGDRVLELKGSKNFSELPSRPTEGSEELSAEKKETPPSCISNDPDDVVLEGGE